ncbi:putative baseplate assembly protein [Pleurocapsa sp. PCC 7319]|uniref:putative baseplate assembly protein n=1 Tax=Pleurocapsa sp. PCC 7319 TaxID=118161 RepID=UPI0005642019|nr:putative baseplate assembly protein [Pleurocapsa sp. PCC 7319]
MKTHHRNKSLSPPKIDARDFSTLVSEIKQLIPFYTPEWQVSQDRNSGSALLNIFARMVAGTIEQLNQVPEKNFIAFLNLLGVKLLPAQPARVPVSFSLSEGTKENILVLARTKVSAERNTIKNESIVFETERSTTKNEPIVFETEKSISVTPGKLVTAYSVNPKIDSIFPAPPGFLTGESTPVVTQLIEDGKLNDTRLFLEDASETEAGDILKIGNDLYYEYLEIDEVKDRQIKLQDRLTANYLVDNTVVEKVVNFELFTGKNQQEHSLYLGHSTLFNLTGNARLTLEIQPEDSLTQLADTNLVSWQYWGEDRATKTLRWYPFDNVAIASNRLILEKNGDRQTKPTKINNIDSFWIRCTSVARSLDTNLQLISDLTDIQIDNIEVTVDPSPEVETTASSLDYCLIYNNLQYENKTGMSFQPFQSLEDEYQTIYLGFDAPLSKGLISLFFSLARESDRQKNRPRLNWSYYRKQKAKREWTKLNLRDETNSLAQSGTVELIGSSDFARVSLFNQSLYWIRIVYPEKQSSSLPNPIFRGIYLNTTWASQIETIERETVGSSNGKADQTFTLYRYPVLSEEVWVNEFAALTVKDREQLLARSQQLKTKEIKNKLGNVTEFWVKWQPVADLLDSTTSDCTASRLRSKSRQAGSRSEGLGHRHYEIDRFLGKITFGDGKNAMIPPTGFNNIQVTYRVGGGKQGNVPRGQINRLNTSIAYIDRITNPEPAKGGIDSELIERALKRGTQFLKHRHRAVTTSDFERLSQQADRSVAKVKCLPNINNQGQPELGWVSIVIVPNSKETKPYPSLQLKQRVKTYLQQRTTNLVTVPKRLDVRSPVYVEIAIKTQIIAIAFDLVPEVELMAKQRLDAFLHPLTGGDRGRGWAFGRSPCKSDFYALLESIPGVDRVDSLSLVSANNRAITVPDYALVSTGEHQIKVTSTW